MFVVLAAYLVSLSIEPAPHRRPAAAGPTGAEAAPWSIWFNYLDQILIYVGLALSLNLLLGYAGQVSVAHAAFGADRRLHDGLPHAEQRLELPRRGRCSASCSPSSSALLVSLPALKLSVEYLILLTLAVSSVIIGLFTASPTLGGTYGLISLPKVQPVRLDLQRPTTG